MKGHLVAGNTNMKDNIKPKKGIYLKRKNTWNFSLGPALRPGGVMELMSVFVCVFVCLSPLTHNSKFNHNSKIPHTGNTRPSCTCVIQEYWYYTMSLSQYHGFFNTMSPCVYHESMSIPRTHTYTISSCLYYESMPMLWVIVNFGLYQELVMPFGQKIILIYEKYFNLVRTITISI